MGSSENLLIEINTWKLDGNCLSCMGVMVPHIHTSVVRHLVTSHSGNDAGLKLAGGWFRIFFFFLLMIVFLTMCLMTG